MQYSRSRKGGPTITVTGAEKETIKIIREKAQASYYVYTWNQFQPEYAEPSRRNRDALSFDLSPAFWPLSKDGLQLLPSRNFFDANLAQSFFQCNVILVVPYSLHHLRNGNIFTARSGR